MAPRSLAFSLSVTRSAAPASAAAVSLPSAVVAADVAVVDSLSLMLGFVLFLSSISDVSPSLSRLRKGQLSGTINQQEV